MKKELTGICAMTFAIGVLLMGCKGSTISDASNEQESKGQFTPSVILTYQAEEAAFTGNVKAVESSSASNDSIPSGYTGSGYVDGFLEDSDTCIFTVEVPETNFYDLNFVSASTGGEKYNYISVDKEEAGTVYIEESEYTDSVLQHIYLTEGTHEITIS